MAMTRDPEAPTQPRTDGWVWLWTVVLAVSLAWTLLALRAAAFSELCDERGECWGAGILAIVWFYGQLAAAVPSIIGIFVLIRYVYRGNRGLPLVGLRLFLVNIATSVVLFSYLSSAS